MNTIRVAQDFSRHPAGRFKSDGPYSGEHFRQKYLVPPLRDGLHVVVILDGARGYGSSFLEEAFGGLVRVEGFERSFLKSHLDIQSASQSLREEIMEYIDLAEPAPSQLN